MISSRIKRIDERWSDKRILLLQDVAWHMRHMHLFGSVGDDKMLCIWDSRKPSNDGVNDCCTK